MQTLGESLVDVDDHRILALRIKVLGFQENALERNAIHVFETDQFRGAPVEPGALRIAVTDLLQVLEVGAGDPQIGKLIKTRSGEHHRFSVSRFGWIAEIFCGHCQLFGQAAINTIAIESRVSRLFVFCAQQHGLRRINPALFRIQTNVAKRGCLSSPDAVGQILRSFTIRRHLPDVVTVIQEHVVVVFGPTGSTIGSRRRWRVVLFVEEVRRKALSEIYNLAVSDGIRIPIFAVEIDRILCIRRQRNIKPLFGGDELAAR